MRYWIVMFRPETYELAKRHGIIGVAAPHGTRFSEFGTGDKFVIYLSGLQQLDGYGEIVGSPFVDVEPIFGEQRDYPHRCRVGFTKVGCKVDGREALWGLSPFSGEMKTVPANYLFLKGGFMGITKADYDWVVGIVEGKPVHQTV